ncbi:tyrosine-type recombinase/integrase [Campylobacter sp. MOP7]|uniref:tyrosine-type recombinase/integrase n=1 Tax=Campylobacter canis TaxID=3378588 RepID=UPI00387EABE6
MQSNKKMDFADEMSMYRDNFISYNNIADKSINTINTYKNCLDSFVEFCYENNDELSFKTLQQKDITNYFIYLDNLYKKKQHNTTQNKKKSISTSTKAHYITILKIFFKYITNNNHNFIDLEKILSTYKITKKKQHKFENFMTREERDKILLFLAQALNKNKNFKNMRNSLLIKLMLQSGLRISEALSLKFSDFSKSDDGEFYDITILAKGGEYQTAFIASDLIDRELHFLFSSKIGDYIFTNGVNDTPITRQNAYELLARIYRKCGIVGKRGCHILRHSFAMNFVEKNTNLGIIQKALRHKKIQTTMIYADPTSEMVKKEMKRIASV